MSVSDLSKNEQNDITPPSMNGLVVRATKLAWANDDLYDSAQTRHQSVRGRGCRHKRRTSSS
jgi:hypothetical protein